MKKEVVELQKRMFEEGMDIYYIPSSDFHASEYMHDYFKVREYISGFTGSFGEMVVTEDDAYLWTDGRYFIQAEKQLSGSGIQLMKMKEDGVPTVREFITNFAENYLKTHEDRFVIGFDGRVTPANFVSELEASLADVMEGDKNPSDEGYGRISLKTDEDLAESIWKERPEIIASEIYELPISSAGKSAEEKISEMRISMKSEGADYILLSELMETAWLFNLRGSDVAYTPVFFAYTLIARDEVRLYTMSEPGFSEKIPGVIVKPYDCVYEDVAQLEEGARIWLDKKTCNFELFSKAENKLNIYDAPTAASTAKMVKNEIEIRSARNAHIKDGLAVTRFIKWIKEETAAGRLQSEESAADYLEKLRREQKDIIDISFSTIAGYGANAALPHYETGSGADTLIKPEGFFLVDSGGQYIDGTTDITRTIAMGALTQEMKDHYTYVLKSHIAFADMKYKKGMSGKEIDEMVRRPMKDAGLDFNHGISHGVGHVLSVHEDAAVIRSTNEEDAGIKAGMIMSNEPGYYLEGEYGIRTENLVLFKEDEEGAVINEPLTCVPYETEAINKSLLSDFEIKWINDYHAWVYETLSPLMDSDDESFLNRQTSAL